ncbi:MAG TPA: hypothetical protein VGU61_04045 [Noviherbaspirillum sp.]|jgi:hypothetical protein|uniref:hypothetical protein n=1 Tax=Noviherbaspirillum sp. TaxID=1926288 RepID=UPI002DDD8131|nr:hypothetical protein [Noviherbaspirillum sp.]HEV2609416.1 hypothetical protein [Noviherbaspirillum sp.]
MPSKTILLAIRPQDLPLVTAALGSEFDVKICHTYEEAKANLKASVGLIACGVHFDHGSMFDLLRAAKADPQTCCIPFYLLLGEGTVHSQAVLDGIRKAAKLLGAAGFTDLSRLRADLGKQQAYEILRQTVRQALST